MSLTSDNGFAQVALSNPGSRLLDLLTVDDIVPGSTPSYETCKTIYVYHPLGAKMAESPIKMAQSQEREITVAGAPESRLIPAFKREWKAMGVVGADALIASAMRTARIYGISSLVVGERGKDPAEPLDLANIANADLYFNIMDPLNTAGSLVLNQDPNAPDFQKPKLVRSAGQEWHSSRCVVMMNEQPIYIEFTASAFGFVGRSVYQRALYPLKTYIQSMITDDTVTKKIALLIWKAKSPSSAITQRIQNIFGWKRAQLQSGVTGNVLQIGHEEDIQSLNFQNLEGAGKFTRENVLKNIATAADMPAGLLDQETMVEGFGEGSEDAKQIARYIDRVRIEMQPLYACCDEIAMRRAWNRDFYKDIQREFEEFRGKPYETAFMGWRNAFAARWPNLLTEPDSERAKAIETKAKSVIAMVEVLAPIVGPKGKAKLAVWAADETAEQKEIFSAPLVLEEQELLDDPPAEQIPDDEESEPKPVPFSRDA